MSANEEYTRRTVALQAASRKMHAERNVADVTDRMRSALEAAGFVPCGRGGPPEDPIVAEHWWRSFGHNFSAWQTTSDAIERRGAELVKLAADGALRCRHCGAATRLEDDRELAKHVAELAEIEMVLGRLGWKHDRKAGRR